MKASKLCANIHDILIDLWYSIKYFLFARMPSRVYKIRELENNKKTLRECIIMHAIDTDSLIVVKSRKHDEQEDVRRLYYKLYVEYYTYINRYHKILTNYDVDIICRYKVRNNVVSLDTIDQAMKSRLYTLVFDPSCTIDEYRKIKDLYPFAKCIGGVVINNNKKGQGKINGNIRTETTNV